MNHLLILSLGPVQDFVAAARRTRDLWFGSWLLSELARAAAKALEAHQPECLIFPSARRLDDKTVSFANKLVALVGDPQTAESLARQAIQRRLEELRNQAFSNLGGQNGFYVEVANRQIADLIEVEAVSALIGEEGYVAARNRAEALLLARKNTRPWGPVTWGGGVPKSSIDGVRESVLDESLFPAINEDDHGTERKAQVLLSRFKAKPTERLCGVSLLKRLGHDGDVKGKYGPHRFLSTGHVAAAPLLERLRTLSKNEQLRSELILRWNAFATKLAEAGALLEEQEIFVEGNGHPLLGRYDGSLLFENRLPDLFLPTADSQLRKERSIKPAEALKAFLKAAEVPTPCPYYAILLADGDRMGEAIQRITDVPRHRALSDALSSFAERARSIVEGEHDGELVYAGGDDVLAFVPLHRVLACAEALGQRFESDLAEFSDAAGASPTLSVGIGISHFLDPLRGALDLARQAERDAKLARDAASEAAKADGKRPLAGLAIHIDKRSGDVLKISGPRSALVGEIKNLVERHLQEEIPDKAAFDREKLSYLVHEPLTQGDRATLERLVDFEAVRVLQRKRPDRGVSEEIDVTIRDSVVTIARNGSEPRLGTNRHLSIAESADRWIAARLFAEAETQAKPPKEDAA